MKKGYIWWITRPTRDLHDLEPAIQAFAKCTRGKKWKGNRTLHSLFEKNLTAKTASVGRDGSGGRTWAAWLRMWGLWYDDSDVKITSAGDILITGNHSYTQISRLIMNFQIPSSYSQHKQFRDDFKIFPFRFIIELLLDKRICYLKESEIAFFVINAKKHADYEHTVNQIIKYRELEAKDNILLTKRTQFIQQHMLEHRPNTRTDTPKNLTGYIQYVKDIANTVTNNVRYLQDIEYVKHQSVICIEKNSVDKMRIMLDKYENEFKFSTLYKYGEKAFVEHFGLRFDRKKSSKKNTSPNTPRKKIHNRIISAYDEIRKTNPNPKIAVILEYIHNKTGYGYKEIESVLSDTRFYSSPSHIDPDFVEYYIQCGKSGKDAAEFEKLGRLIFNDIGFETNKHKIIEQKRGEPEIDGLSLNKSKSGILEFKSGSVYSLTIGDREKMKNVYIPYFYKRSIKGKTRKLDFFVYIVGNKITGMGNFLNIIKQTGLNGSIIYAKDLIMLYDVYKSGKISKDDVWDIFKKNKLVTWKDILKN